MYLYPQLLKAGIVELEYTPITIPYGHIYIYIYLCVCVIGLSDKLALASPALLILVSGTVGTHDHIFILFGPLSVLQRDLLLTRGGV
jgi:hypothetical protein